MRIATMRALLMTLGCAISQNAVMSPARAASDIHNACTIFQERAAWHHAVVEVSNKRQVPVPMILAVMHHESGFKATAAAKRSTAYGFAQVLDGTWNWYRKAANASTAERTNFADSADFIAWYVLQTQERFGLPPHDVASHYIAYHEGHGGYRSTRWAEKPQLINIAHKVASIAAKYEEQLRGCGLSRVAEADAAPLSSPPPLRKPFGLAKVSANLPRRKPISALVAQAGDIRPASVRTIRGR